MFGIDASDISGQLRELIRRLCAAELLRHGLPLSAFTAGGDQDAPDGGMASAADDKLRDRRPLMHNSVKNSATDGGDVVLGASLIFCRGGGCPFLWSLIGHVLVVLVLLQLGHRVTGEPPQLLVSDVQFVREAPSTAPPVPPAGQVAPSKALPARIVRR